jgi:hypothetical protein
MAREYEELLQEAEREVTEAIRQATMWRTFYMACKEVDELSPDEEDISRWEGEGGALRTESELICSKHRFKCRLHNMELVHVSTSSPCDSTRFLVLGTEPEQPILATIYCDPVTGIWTYDTAQSKTVAEVLNKKGE